jgi:ribosomal protein S3
MKNAAKDFARYMFAASIAFMFTTTVGPQVSSLILQFILATWLVGRWERRRAARARINRAMRAGTALN